MSLKKNKDHLVFYSVNTTLAYWITSEFYKNNHYFWAADFFDDSATNPTSSNPKDIYSDLMTACRKLDVHSSKIKANRVAIIKGAKIQHDKGIITLNEFNDIQTMATEADIALFKPLLYVIPNINLEKHYKKVSRTKRANVISREYLFESIPRELFHVIQY